MSWNLYDGPTSTRRSPLESLRPQEVSMGPKVVGYEPKIAKRCTCGHCGAIIEYLPIHERETGNTDEGTRIKGVNCPNCGTFRRTN